MPTFTPPSHLQAIGGGLWRFFGVPVGQTVANINDTFVEHSFPAWEDLAELTEGTDYFWGGRTYWVNDDLAAALEADGFTVVPDDGYGDGAFGSGGYGG